MHVSGGGVVGGKLGIMLHHMDMAEPPQLPSNKPPYLPC